MRNTPYLDIFPPKNQEKSTQDMSDDKTTNLNDEQRNLLVNSKNVFSKKSSYDKTTFLDDISLKNDIFTNTSFFNEISSKNVVLS